MTSTNEDPWEIPDFLTKPRGWKPEPLPRGKRLRLTKDMKFAPPPSKQEEAATKALRREIEAMEKAKRDAQIAKLRLLPRKKRKRKSPKVGKAKRA
jgi:hypothetical protein